MHKWNNKVAVVTGAGSGIGRALALELAQHGCHLVLADISEKGLAETRGLLEPFPVQVSTHRVDVTKKDQMARFAEAVAEEYDCIHILFNNAGITIDKSFMEHSLEEWELIVGINFWGVVYGCHFFMPLLEKAGEAHIVNTSSLAGFLGIPTQSSYCATKAAVRALSESLWAELKEKNIHVTSVHPGAIRTNIFNTAIEHSSDPDAARQMFDMISKVAMEPGKAVSKIIAAAVAKKPRVIIGMDAYMVEWAKRVAPVGIHRLFAWGMSMRRK